MSGAWDGQRVTCIGVVILIQASVSMYRPMYGSMKQT
jgi:hypothetical protein